MDPIILYFTIINTVAAIICCYDKLASIKRKRRVSEKSLMFVSAFGGAVAMYLTMGIIKHKTRHNKFMVGLPIIIAIQAVVLFLIYSKVI